MLEGVISMPHKLDKISNFVQYYRLLGPKKGLDKPDKRGTIGQKSEMSCLYEIQT